MTFYYKFTDTSLFIGEAKAQKLVAVKKISNFNAISGHPNHFKKM